MKKYEVEFRRTSYVCTTVEAESRDEAEEKAWQELANLQVLGNIDDAAWETESIEEIRDANAQ